MSVLNTKQLWLVDALAGVFSKVSEEGEADLEGALPFDISDLLNKEGVPAGVRGFFETCLNPTSPIFLTVLVAFASAAVGALVSRVMPSMLAPVSQWAQSKFPYALVDPASLITYHRWNPLWEDDYHKAMLLHGFNKDRANLMYDAALPRPGLGEILAAHIKRFTPLAAPRPAKTGYAWADAWLPTYTNANLNFPSVTDTVTLLARGVIERPEFGVLMSRNNYDSHYVQNVRKMLYNVLGPSDIATLRMRGPEPDAAYQSELARIEFDPHYYDMLKELAWTYPGVTDYAQYMRRLHGADALPVGELARLGWKPEYAPMVEELSWSVPAPADIARHAHHEGLALTDYRDRLSRVGLHPKYHNIVNDLSLTRPSPAEWFAYAHRMEVVPDIGPAAMTKLGYNPNYWGVYETLSHPMPGVSDLVMMAVREVFSPEVAEAFGQFEEIPTAYIDNAAKIGLTEEWARNYWAAHWTLPSVMQGFDMLHRGSINQDELAKLFVALDIMPFWRKRLTDISYRLLTRVDVRRMYREGTLSYPEVLESYESLGYSKLNAQRMTDFTVAYVRRQEIGFTRSQVLGAYKDRALSADDAREMLDLLGIRGEDAEFALDLVDFDVEQAREKRRINIIKTEYGKGLLTRNDASIRLDALEIVPARKTLLLDEWEAKRQSKVRTFSKSETMRYLVNGAMTYEQAMVELDRIGYSHDQIMTMLSQASMNAIAIRGKRRQLSQAEMMMMLKSGTIDMKVYAALLVNYGWRNPELQLIVCDVASAADAPLPEGYEPCVLPDILKTLAAS